MNETNNNNKEVQMEAVRISVLEKLPPCKIIGMENTVDIWGKKVKAVKVAMYQYGMIRYCLFDSITGDYVTDTF